MDPWAEYREALRQQSERLTNVTMALARRCGPEAGLAIEAVRRHLLLTSWAHEVIDRKSPTAHGLLRLAIQPRLKPGVPLPQASDLLVALTIRMCEQAHVVIATTAERVTPPYTLPP